MTVLIVLWCVLFAGMALTIIFGDRIQGWFEFRETRRQIRNLPVDPDPSRDTGAMV